MTGRPGLRDLAVFFREFHLVIRSGLPVRRGLRVIEEATPNPALKKAIETMRLGVERGGTLGAAMASSEAFPAVAVKMTVAGEQGGGLEDTMNSLASLFERQSTLQLKIRQALTYPVFVFVGCLVFVVFVTPFLLDGIFSLLVDLKMPLPWFTRLLMGLARMARSPFFYLGLAVLGTTGTVWGPAWLSHPPRKKLLWRGLMATPAVGQCLHYMQLAMFCSTLEAALTRGLPILQGLALATQVTGNPLLEESLKVSQEALRLGETVVNALRRADFIPPTYMGLIESGEQAGHLPMMLGNAANMAQQEVEHRLDLAVALLEPMMLMGMGVMAACIALGCLVPLAQVIDKLAG